MSSNEFESGKAMSCLHSDACNGSTCSFYFQLVDLKDTEREWLAEHLGHTLGVHKSHYRLQEPIIEMAQFGRLLIAVEAGKASNFCGKKN